MKKIFTFIAVFGFIFLVSCSKPFTMDDNGSTVQLSLHSEFEVQLVGNPSTGYVWQVADLDKNVIKQVGEASFEPDSKMIGSPGTYTFTFENIAAGDTELIMNYVRRNEPAGEANKTFKLNIISGTMGRIEAD